ncbi:hypothetical protein BS50DRAFT_19661 [Corynespora cassiicola Philippines]|uniref:Amino acid permease/ SLC12A domain-containing protein n=1 Tax=Corynespora cassiicola Philippines TaxID=1448308 RepID=A0A2T2PAM2_CORCC|nr:hypothetical protein BS50DRAFT_19661 [Corynespora cassiicola Philippines]
MADTRPLDRNPYYAEHYEHLDRILNRPQLAGIGISGCVGAGIFLTSGALIATTGSLGGALSYLVAGIIVACVLYTLTEMVACRPLTGVLIDLPHTFLDPACGFAVAASYGLSKICSMAALTAYSAELTALLKNKPGRHEKGPEVAINIAFILLTTASHCLGVKLYGKIERVIMWFKISLLVLVCILMLVINFGAGGHRQTSYQTNYTTHAFTPGFKPTGFLNTETPILRSSGVADTDFGITGAGGQLFAFITTVTLAMFSCFGGELVAMTAGEAKEPWKDIPIVMSFVYLVPLAMYPFVLMSAGANVNYADPNLPKIWGRSNRFGSNSPFVIAIMGSSLHGLPKVLNVFFIISAYTTANTTLYAASRSVFMLSQQYLPKKIADIFGKTNNGHTPLRAILLCSALGFLSLIGLADNSNSQPRITLTELYTGTLACVYICECVTFLKFKAGLDRLEKRKIFSRNDELYITRLFKSRWQPVPAYIGIFGCTFVVVWSGIPPLYILIARQNLTSTANLKPTSALAFDVLGAYIGPIIFATFYLTYKYIHPRSSSVDLRDLTPGNYILGDLSTIEREGPESMPANPWKSLENPNAMELEAQRDSIDPDRRSSFPLSTNYPGFEMSPETYDEREAQRARREERERIRSILENRPKRLERGFWRELWSFVVVDRD